MIASFAATGPRGIDGRFERCSTACRWTTKSATRAGWPGGPSLPDRGQLNIEKEEKRALRSRLRDTKKNLRITQDLRALTAPKKNPIGHHGVS
jgi:hypothetical protein